MAVVPVLPDGGLHLLLHGDELPVLPTQVQQQRALGRPAATVVAATPAAHQPVWQEAREHVSLFILQKKYITAYKGQWGDPERGAAATWPSKGSCQNYDSRSLKHYNPCPPSNKWVPSFKWGLCPAHGWVWAWYDVTAVPKDQSITSWLQVEKKKGGYWLVIWCPAHDQTVVNGTSREKQSKIQVGVRARQGPSQLTQRLIKLDEALK